LTEELIHVLAGVRELRVVARTSSFQFRGSNADVHQIGRALHADLILEGSVRLAGEQLRVTARLASVAEGIQLWSRRYDRKLEHVFQIQDEIAGAILTALRSTLGSIPVRHLVSQDTHDLEAFKLYLKGRHFWNQLTAAGFRSALDCFHEAIARDARLSRAYAGMAETYVLMMMHNLEPPQQLMPKAREAALAALGVDAGLAQARSSLGCGSRLVRLGPRGGGFGMATRHRTRSWLCHRASLARSVLRRSQGETRSSRREHSQG
jgi:hypothetical protein